MENIDNYPTLKIVVSKNDTADYAGKIARGDPLPENPYSLSLYRCPATDVRHETEYWYYGEKWFTTYNTGIFQTADSYSRLSSEQRRSFETAFIDKATNAALAKIKGQSLPILQMYLERKEVAGFLSKLVDDSIFIARNVKRPARIFRHFGLSTKTQRYRNTRSKVKAIMLQKGSTVGDAWLQYRMFLVPTYHDVLTSLSAAADYEKKSHTFEAVVKRKINETSRISYDSYDGIVLTAERPGTMTVSGGVTVRIKYSITDHSLSALSSLTDIKAVMWDLTPWSFIIDRFADISTYLELSNATIGTTFSKGSISSMFRWEGSTSGPWIAAYYPNKLTYKLNGYVVRWAGMPGCSLYDLAVRRTVLSKFPTPVLEFPFRQGWKQITDEIILVRKLLARKLGS